MFELVLTFISGDKVLDVLGNVLVEMQLADVERLDDCAVVQHQETRVSADLKHRTSNSKCNPESSGLPTI